MLHEFSRTELLLGKDGMERLKNSRVTVFGIGGVGSHCIEALARSGVGHLTLVDNDTVSVTNINRQSIALHSTVGLHKTKVMKEKLLDINPEISISLHEQFVLPENAEVFFEEKPDFIVDAIDTVSAKIALAVLAEEYQVPIISCMGTGNKLDPSAFEIADIYDTKVCPLCRVMRRELKKRGVKGLTVLYSREEPVSCGKRVELSGRGASAETETKGTAGRPVPGSIAFVPPVAGLMMAAYVIRRLVRPESQRGAENQLYG
ncbi:tRNA threonylcarbamoyladenosine dehydratase [Fusibacillus kribbianus]|uniref:tRNA threonylcarbamoyladenosine dehydratase n=1 Tax=Fusibacillus kribbianus TaxID=3044208 RepID=A0AAP4BB15_9FIRM|nr:tRNA threonylcarbamoyladenosine dehydratase [Ruminococcus sp. YH-rum2234]MDI9241129.1 tRNA threonylcarbamoyladenosine dehydratase [Ruminococcus sp. YH-rum2234]